ncbi:hypothetical protein GE061_018393 [Apolygus lucorum]|uniref:alpha-glucosidase n=1 Tax=Apolygus lucorum TaxID=248454 RepID=A0A8S9XF47_APOLU|nr:hypothetical protein GE061_018393 [Apolygus lucorum]
MLDLVPNHSSNESQWFLDSVSQANGKDDWYVWRIPKGYDAQNNPLPPNNWRSLFGGSAWTFNEARGQFYLHQFGVFQPDLNYNNTEVVNQMKDVIRYWLGFGVDGFRVDAVPFIAETNYSSDEPEIQGCEPTDAYSCLDHIYTMDQDLTYEILEQFAAVLQEQNANYSSSVKVQFVEAYTTVNATMRYYTNHSNPFNFLMVTSVDKNTNATELQNLTQSYLEALPEGAWPNWVIGNHDNSRVGTRMGSDLIDAMNMLVLLLPGTPVTYNGEEIGMTDGFVRVDQYRDPNTPNRDPERTPMQWNTSVNAGFSTNVTDPYLPVNPNYWEVNVATETSNEPSHLSVYKQLVALNKELAASTSTNLTSAVLSDWVFAFLRDNYLVVVNLNNEVETFALNALNFSIGDSVTVKIPSINSLNFKVSDSISTSTNISLYPRSGVVFTTTSSAAAVTAAISLLLASVCLSLRRL